MNRKYSLNIKIFWLLTFVATIVISINSYISFNTSMHTHKNDAYNHLTSIREMKARQVESYLTTIRSQISTFSESRMTIDAMKGFKEAYNNITNEVDLNAQENEKTLKRIKNYYRSEFLPRLSENTLKSITIDKYIPKNKSALLLQDMYISNNQNPTGQKHILVEHELETSYNKLHTLFHPIIRDYLEKFGYYDIFLVDNETGNIIYSVFKEVDFGTSLLKGPYKDTNFAQVFKAAKDTNDRNYIKLVDYQPYAPSYNAPASFIASPIYDGDKKIGVLVFQMPVDKINEIMTDNGRWKDVGLGESGETYIVGEDYTLRNQSRFLVEDKNSYLEMIKAIGLKKDVVNQIDKLNNAIGLQVVKTKGTIAALDNKIGTEIFEDYRGVSVLSSYKPLKVQDVHWVIMSEIDEQEAFKDVKEMRDKSILLFLGLLIFIIIISILFARKLTKPIKNLQNSANELSQGNLDVEIKKESSDEIGDLATSFNIMKNSMKKLITDLKDINQNLEIKVKERTKEIKMAYDELDVYKNQLEVKVEEEIKKRQETMAIKERMEGELNIAHDIQMSMIPLLFPVFTDYKEFSLFAKIKPAREVGGDFYDFYFIDENHLCIVIGDVSGKGVPAALFMAVSKTLIKSRASDDLSPASIVSYVNEEMSIDNPASMFVTLFIGVLDLNTGTLKYTNAGHNPPYIVKPDGTISVLNQRHGPIVGAVDGITYSEGSTVLNQKDKLLLFTDGVTEAMNVNGELFGEEKLENYLIESHALQVTPLIDELMETVSDHEAGCEQSDDITLLAFEYFGRELISSDTISIKNHIDSLSTVAQYFESLSEKYSISMPVTHKMNIALDDLLNNIISYGYNDDQEHIIELQFEYSKNRLSVIISDDGIPFNPFEEKPVDTSLSIDEREIGGLGIHLVREMVDRYSYSRKINRNVVTLTMDLD